MSATVNAGEKAVTYVDERFASANFFKRSMGKVFPDHWSFMLGEIALYSFIIILLSGVFLTLFFNPSMTEVIYDGSYAPLSRPLYIYVDKKSWAKPEVKGFVTYFVTNDASIAEAAKFIALSEEQKAKATSEIAALG